MRDLPRFRTFKTAALIDRFRFRRPRAPWVLREADFVDLEDVLALPPELRLDRPIDGELHVHFAAGDAAAGEAGFADPATVAMRLGTGSPFRRIIFHAPDAATARYVEECTGIRPAVAHDADGGADRGADIEAATIRCARFGPIALHVSAFWGAGGSHRLHAAQVRHLLGRGYYVFRLFVDHYPEEPWNEFARNRRLMRECLGGAFGHACSLAIRDTSAVALEQERSLPAFLDASPIERLNRVLEGALLLDPNAAAWAGTRAAVAIVNHLMHVGLTERITRAPIILETHDICSDLLDSHGVPYFVPDGPDSPERRAAEEQALWTRVAACVNLSPADHAVIARHARVAEFIRPIPTPPDRPPRSWAETAAANAFPQPLWEAGKIDVLLWGSNHRGKPDPLGDPGRVFRLDHVEAIEDLFAHAEVLVIPDRGGTGISIKTMDALASGRAFAATPQGLRGLDLGALDYRGAGGDAEFAADIGALLRDPALRSARAAQGAALRERNYREDDHRRGWDRVLAAVPHAQPRGPSEVAIFDGTAVPRGRPPADPRISVLVCTYERHELLDQCLMSLFDQTAPPDSYEILVIDNSADQAGAARNARRFDGTRVRYLLEPVPGISNARNVGMHATQAPIVAFIDDDAIATRTWIEAMLAAFDAYPNAGAVGGRFLPFWAFERPDWMHDGILGFVSRVDWKGRLRPTRPNEWLAGGNLGFSRQDLLDAGAFDSALGRRGSDRILLSNEENAMIRLLRDRGKTIVYAPDACVEHWIHAQRLTPSWIRRRMAWQAVSDFVANEPVASDPVPSFAKRLDEFYAAHPDAKPGFFKETNDPDRFLKEAQTAYDAVMVMLLGGAECEPEAAPAGGVPETVPTAAGSPWRRLLGGFRRRR
jgi:GT2 family glycosyltransferase